MSTCDYLFKLSLVGTSQTGKTCLTLKFAENRFNPSHNPTVGVDFAARMLKVDGKICMFQIWDTGGSELYWTFARTCCKAVSGVIMVFDLSKHETFEVIDTFYKDVRSLCNGDLMGILVGNKSDKEGDREVTFEEAVNKAKEFKMPYIEVSAKDGTNVDECFRLLARMIMSRYSDPITSPKKLPKKEVLVNLEEDFNKRKLQVIEKIVNKAEGENAVVANIKKVLNADLGQKFKVDSKGNVSIH